MRSLLVSAVLLLSLPFSVGCQSGQSGSPAAKTEIVKPAPETQNAKGTPTGPLVLGAPITEKQVALTEIAKNPKSFADKTIATSGTVVAVCEHMGCWMELKSDDGEAHVKLAGHNFFVPKTAKGRTARVQAKLVNAPADDECKEEAKAQMGKPVAKLELEATGVELN